MNLPIQSGYVTLRCWVPSDSDQLVEEADSRVVWRNLTHHFPSPYAQRDADSWIARCIGQEPARDLVITHHGRLVGVCGIEIGEGVNAYTGEIGYWLGDAHWGQGIASSAFALFLTYVWDTFDVERLEARVFAWNPASARVLEKNGFVLEGTRRKAIHKDGEFVDERLYSLLRGEAGAP